MRYNQAKCYSQNPTEKVFKHFKAIWVPSSEFVSSSIPSWQISTAHAQPFREARDLAFCLKVPLDSMLVWASSGGSGETARMRRLAWTFAARIGDKYQIRLARPIYNPRYLTCKVTKKASVRAKDLCDIYNVRLNQTSQNSNQKLCDTKVINCSETENQVYCPPVKCADLSSYVGHVTQKSICSNRKTYPWHKLYWTDMPQSTPMWWKPVETI